MQVILERNNLKTAQEWTKSYIELIASYVHPKKRNNLRSHLRAIMALVHRRLIRPGKKKSGRIFCVRQVYFTRCCQQIWVRVNEPFIPFIHHIWGETVLWDTASSFIIQTSDRMQYFTILQYRLYSFNIQDDRSTRGLLAKPALKKKIPKSRIRPAGSHFCGASCGQVFEWTLIELRSNIIKKLLCLFSYLMVLSMCNRQKRLIRAAFWVLLQAIFTERLKTNGTAIKITRETTNNQWKK